MIRSKKLIIAQEVRKKGGGREEERERERRRDRDRKERKKMIKRGRVGRRERERAVDLRLGSFRPLTFMIFKKIDFKFNH